MNWTNFFLLFAIAFLVFFVGCVSEQNSFDYQEVPKEFVVPKNSIHWHPKLQIKVNNQLQQIPTGIGISIGKMIDFDVSGMNMSPIHTHEGNGTIHIENQKPWLKPGTLTLGYFFHVWSKKFSSECIFDYCNNEKSKVKMFVNGKENQEFEKYVMQDKDDILIVYE